MQFEKVIDLALCASSLASVQDTHDAWGERIRKERQGRGLTAKQLGDLIDVSEATISRIETGRCPSDDLKWRLASVFGLRMDLLFSYPAVVPEWSKNDELTKATAS